MSDRLQEILATMDIPEGRRNDFGWLARNMAIRNRDHEQFGEACELLRMHLRAHQFIVGSD
jgi:hypothetical protein